MARQKGKFISGILGRLIFKVVNDTQVIAPRPAPGTVKQTKETKRASNTFGMAATLGAAIRRVLAGQLMGYYDFKMVNRFSGMLTEILTRCRDPKSRLYQFQLNSFEDLDGFEFNMHSKLTRMSLNMIPLIELKDQELRVYIPETQLAKNLKFPDGSFQCRINVSVSLFRLKEGLMKAQPETKTLVVNGNRLDKEELDFRFMVPNGCLYVLTVFLVYETAFRSGLKSVNHKKLNPGVIWEAMISPGEYSGGDQINWSRMIKFE